MYSLFLKLTFFLAFGLTAPASEIRQNYHLYKVRVRPTHFSLVFHLTLHEFTSVWAQCPYVNRDGQFNPDRVLVTDLAEFTSMSDAVMYNSMAWVITNTSSYSAHAANHLNTWFLNKDTMMNHNLNYAQLTRGPREFDPSFVLPASNDVFLMFSLPDGAAQHTGLLDLKTMARIATAVMILRKGNSPDWTKDMDTQLTNWTTSYLS